MSDPRPIAGLPDCEYLAFPFVMTKEGPASCGRSDSIRQRIEQVLFTSPCERLFRPDFGAGVPRLVFEPNGSVLWELTRRHLQSSLLEALRGDIDPAGLAVDVVGESERLVITVRYRLLALSVSETQRFELPGRSDG